jgi:hypothetical protein
MLRSKPYLTAVPDPQPLNWQCSHCHLLNPPELTKCYSCSAPRLQGRWPEGTWFQKRRPVALANTIKKEEG